MCDLSATLDAIDDANAADPNRFRDEPLARAQGRLGSRWLAQLDPTAPPELQVAVRAHHLRRWEILRADFADGRAGYLQWRRRNKAHQAESLAGLMHAHGWSDAAIERARELLGRTGLRTDPDTQTLEDAACLVFLGTQFNDVAERLDRDHLVTVVAKTLTKMSEQAITLATTIDLNADERLVLADAVASFEAGVA